MLFKFSVLYIFYIVHTVKNWIFYMQYLKYFNIFFVEYSLSIRTIVLEALDVIDSCIISVITIFYCKWLEWISFVMSYPSSSSWHGVHSYCVQCYIATHSIALRIRNVITMTSCKICSWVNVHVSEQIILRWSLGRLLHLKTTASDTSTAWKM